METIGFACATFISPLGNLSDDLTGIPPIKGQALNSRQSESLRKTFCNDTPGSQAWRGLCSVHCGLLIRITWMTSGTFPGQRKFPVSLFKGSPVHWESQVWGIDTDFLCRRDRRGREKPGVRWERGAAQPRACLLPPISSGEHRRGWKSKGSLQFTAFVAAQSQTVSDGVRRLGELKPKSHNVAH